MPDASIHTVGTISEVLSPKLYKVNLSNGKCVLAHLSKSLADSDTEFLLSSRVVLEFTAYDFDQARILRQEN